MEKKTFGSLYLSGQPRSPHAIYNGESISFGDSVLGKAAPFVKWKYMWVASQCICTNISWEDLNQAGFILGRFVRIDGFPYLCRSLKVGAEEGVMGYRSAHNWDHYTVTGRNASVGFRPVLEPLLSDSVIYRSLIGSNLRIYGPDGDVCGQLINLSDYDLIVRPSTRQTLYAGCKWACIIGDKIVIDRSAVAWTKEGV